MKKYLRYIFLFLLLLLISCEDNEILSPGTSPIGTQETIDATSYSEWKYYKFFTDTTLFQIPNIEGWMETSLGWDIAFQRNHIKTNSGTSGIGNSGVYVDSIEIWNGDIFNNFSENVTYYTFVSDTIVNTFYDQSTHTFTEGSSNPILESWGSIDLQNNYTINITNNKFVIRSADSESFYKFWVYDYYNENNESGHISLIFDLICSGEDCE